VTRSNASRFRLGIFALCWLIAAGLQVYVGDIGTHGSAVGAYVPGWLLATAAIPWWALLVPTAIDGLAAWAAACLASGAHRTLTVLNAVGLIAYAFVAIAVIFYIAFANNGVS